jgi:hypothetical protein
MEAKLRYSRKAAALQLDMSVRTLDYSIARKELETLKDGRRIYITRASLLKYAAANHFRPMNDSHDADGTDAAA